MPGCAQPNRDRFEVDVFQRSFAELDGCRFGMPGMVVVVFIGIRPMLGTRVLGSTIQG